MTKRNKDSLHINVKKRRVRIKSPKKGNKHYFDSGLVHISDQALSELKLHVRNDFDREKDEEEFDSFCKAYLTQSGIVARNYVCDGRGVRFPSSNALNGHTNKRCGHACAISLPGSKWLDLDVAKNGLFNCVRTEPMLSYYCKSTVPRISEERIDSAFEQG